MKIVLLARLPQKFFLIGFLMLALGCQTFGYFITDSNLPVSESRKTITAVIGKPRLVSLNGRELLSEYHDAQFKFIEDPAKVLLRYFTKVIILGARRPYEINVQVFEERYDRETRSFVNMGVDDGLSERRAAEIQRAHNYSLEKMQTIDGDAPF